MTRLNQHSIHPVTLPLHRCLQGDALPTWQTADSQGPRIGDEPIVYRRGNRGVELRKLISSLEPPYPILTLGVEPAIAESELNLWVRLSAAKTSENLPRGLWLKITDDLGRTVMQAETRKTQQVQLEFSGQIGEIFGIAIAGDREYHSEIVLI